MLEAARCGQLFGFELRGLAEDVARTNILSQSFHLHVLCDILDALWRAACLLRAQADRLWMCEAYRLLQPRPSYQDGSNVYKIPQILNTPSSEPE